MTCCSAEHAHDLSPAAPFVVGVPGLPRLVHCRWPSDNRGMTIAPPTLPTTDAAHHRRARRAWRRLVALGAALAVLLIAVSSR